MGSDVGRRRFSFGGWCCSDPASASLRASQAFQREASEHYSAVTCYMGSKAQSQPLNQHGSLVRLQPRRQWWLQASQCSPISSTGIGAAATAPGTASAENIIVTTHPNNAVTHGLRRAQ